MTLTVGSLFSGIGGIDLGLERAGMRVAWQSEIDPAASKVLAHHWPEVPNLGDITRIRPDVDAGHERPRRSFSNATARAASSVDVLAGGVPCQDVSIAGKRAGLAGARTGLFYELARLADALRPRYVVIEEVPGLLSSHDGRDMASVLGTLWDCGFHDLAWRVVDSRGFGVPQRRYRLFIVGRAGTGTRVRDVLLEPEGRPWRPPARSQAGAGTTADAARGVALRGRDGGARAELGDESAYTVRASQGGGDKPYALVPDSVSTPQGGGQRGYRVDAEGAAGGQLIPTHARTLTTSNQLIDYETETFLPTHYRKTKNAQTANDDEAWSPDEGYANTLTPFDTGDKRARDLIAAEGSPSNLLSEGDGDVGEVTDPLTLDGDVDGVHDIAADSGGVAGVVASERDVQVDKRCAHGSSESCSCSMPDSPCARKGYNGTHANAQEARPREVLRALRSSLGPEAYEQWGVGVVAALREAQVLRPFLYVGGLRREAIEEHRLVNDALSRPEACATWAVFTVRRALGDGRASPGWGPHEQRARELGAYLSELSHQGAPQREALQDLWRSAQGLGLLRQALSALQEVGRSARGEGQPAHPAAPRVRRLTVTEAERLQGFPDAWTAPAGSDSARYRCLGNAVTVPVGEWVGHVVNTVERLAAREEAA